MSKTPILSRDEARAFLTKADLDSLDRLAAAERLEAIIGEGRPSPYIVVRGKYILLFDALELMGTV